MNAETNRHVVAMRSNETTDREIATAYNQSGDSYIAYADGDPRRLYAFDGQYSYGDRRIWELLDAKLCALRDAGAQSLRVLDLGCGPGTWLRRVVTRARELGFSNIVARGFDIADVQVRRARELAADLSSVRGVILYFEVGDILETFPEPDASVDLCLCLCGVLNHLPTADLAAPFREIARVTRGHFVTTVRAIGSTPTVYVDAIERARRFRQDHERDCLHVQFENGHRLSLYSHLFGAAELRSLIAPHLHIEDLYGLDLFHGRFASDPRWNPAAVACNDRFDQQLRKLEEVYCRDAQFIDHATHLLLVARRRATTLVGDDQK